MVHLRDSRRHRSDATAIDALSMSPRRADAQTRRALDNSAYTYEKKKI